MISRLKRAVRRRKKHRRCRCGNDKAAAKIQYDAGLPDVKADVLYIFIHVGVFRVPQPYLRFILTVQTAQGTAPYSAGFSRRFISCSVLRKKISMARIPKEMRAMPLLCQFAHKVSQKAVAVNGVDIAHEMTCIRGSPGVIVLGDGAVHQRI